MGNSNKQNGNNQGGKQGVTTTQIANTSQADASKVVGAQAGTGVASDTSGATGAGDIVAETSVVSNGTTVTTLEAEAAADTPAVDKAHALGNIKLSSVLVQLGDYVKAMDPGASQTDKGIEAQQIKMLTILQTLVNIDEHEFAAGWRAFLEVVRANAQGCFKVTMRNRGLYGMGLGVMDNKNMRFITRILDLAVVTAGVRDHGQVSKHVDMAKILEAVASPRGKQNLTAYYAG